jgi:hypothetical protein
LRDPAVGAPTKAEKLRRLVGARGRVAIATQKRGENNCRQNTVIPHGIFLRFFAEQQTTFQTVMSRIFLVRQ